MTKEEISKAIEDCAARIEECEVKLKKLREELNKPSYSGKRWKPERGQRYWLVGMYGDAIDAKWTNGDADKQAFAIGNVFPTQEAVDFEVVRRMVIAELSDYAEGEDALWDVTEWHFRICYDYSTGRIGYCFDEFTKFGGPYFPSEKVAKAAVEAVGEERVKKYYLGVLE